jgi:hypothetical protein
MEPTQEAAPSSTALLDALRKRIMPEANAGAAQRLSDIGIGMLASGSPDFFTAVGKGLQAGNTAENSRIQMLRQAAETEEQATFRKAQLELERAKQAYEQDPSNPRNQSYLMQAQAALISANAAAARAGREMRDPWQVIGTDESGSAVVANMRDPSQRQTLSGVEPTSFGVVNRRAAGAGAGREDANLMRALSQARQELAGNLGFGLLPPEEQTQRINARARAIYGSLPSQAGAPAQQEAPTQQRVQLPLVGSAPRRTPTE